MKLTDDAIPGFSSWAVPYRFVVGKRDKWDKSRDEIIHIVDDPVTAYTVFTELSQSDKMKFLFEWYLHDSFGKNAYDFCKKITENPPSFSLEEEKSDVE